MITGALGSVVFEVSDRAWRVLRDMEMDDSASVSVHKTHLGGGLAEYTGYDPRKIKFKVRLSAHMGADPERELGTLRRYLREGRAVPFTMGYTTYGRYRWLIDSLKAKAEYFDGAGNVTSYDVTVSLVEYRRG